MVMQQLPASQQPFASFFSACNGQKKTLPLKENTVGISKLLKHR